LENAVDLQYDTLRDVYADDDDDGDMLMLMLVEILPFKLQLARLTAALLKPLAEEQPKRTYSFHRSVHL
jgi:hypothetical protein